MKKAGVKEAQTDLPVLDLIRHRWSPHTYDSCPIEEEKLRLVLEGARWAPSSYNEQPWRFIVSRSGTEAHTRLLNVLWEKNRKWAERAPIIGVAVASMHLQRNNKPNLHAIHDVGVAMGHLMLQATALGLSVTAIGGFYKDRAQEELGIPDGYQPVVAFTMGYVGDLAAAPGDWQEYDMAPRTRKPIAELVFEGGWEQPLH